MHPLRRSAWSPPQGGGPVGAGCGLLLGLLIGTYWFLADESPQWPILAVGLDLAIVAFVYGDRFWNWLVEQAGWF